MEPPDVAELLAAAVAGIGGAERPGQVLMAEAVQRAIETGEHLAVQAGTGTGKSLAYLVPAVRHAMTADGTVVVATATIALQRQLIDRDLPRLAIALKPVLGREPAFAILKGRRNYLCLHREQGDEDSGALIARPDAGPPSPLGRQVKRLHEWAGRTTTGDRDELVPGVPEAAWRQVSVSAEECIGPRCRFASRCFAERARAAAAKADIVVTNHALLAIDATSDADVLPEHDVVIIDEAHDLVDRVTSAITGELSGAVVDTAAGRAARLTEEGTAAAADQLRRAGAALGVDLGDAPAGRIDVLPDTLTATVESVRDAAAACAQAVRASAPDSAAESARVGEAAARPLGDEGDAQQLAVTRMALASLDELERTAGRILDVFREPVVAAREEVVWLDRPPAEDDRRPATLRVAPLEVGKLLRDRLFGQRTVALTSATLALGRSFTPLAIQWGLPPNGDERLAWKGLDVGSPFDHPRSGILYVARHLPPPGRDQLPEAYLTELEELIDAAGGRTLGLFSSMRAARQAAAALRERIGQPLLCQGDDVTAQLVRQFAEDEPACLFGTLSLWQGVDVPGSSLQLVVIDRIPFPRPDDPLASARQRAVAARGGNGFMTVAASQAALLLAQGSGRLLRTVTDRGVVAVLDPRLMTARYGDFLRASLPPFWTTTDPALVRAALRRLAAAAAGTPAPALRAGYRKPG